LDDPPIHIRPDLPTMSAELRQPTDERTRDNAARMAMIERSILALLLVGLLIGVIAVV
jgi:hypothetical protein